LAGLDRRVLLVDGDLALGKLDLLLGEEPTADLGHVLNGECPVEQAVFAAPGGVRVLASPCGRDEFAVLDPVRRERFCAAMARAGESADLVILDLATGIGPNSIELARRAGEIVVVTTPEPTASIDAYALIKILGGAHVAAPRIVVNRARSAEEAGEAFDRLARTASRHLGTSLVSWGHVLEDVAVEDAVRRQIPFFLGAPDAPASRCVRDVAQQLLRGDRPDETDRVPVPASFSSRLPGAGFSRPAARRVWEAA
jgi:flagellar biosynthesis protein FlhG